MLNVTAKVMKKLSFRMALVTIMSFFGSIAIAQTQTEEIDLRNYTRTFTEDFDALDVSEWGPKTRWVARTPWNGDFGDARFAFRGGNSPFNVKDGILTITMRKDRTGQWMSGLLSSKDRQDHGFSQSGGYFEIRAKLPPGAGVWPAFWLVSRDDSGKGKPEIDILEHYGHADNAFFIALHLWKGKDDNGRAFTRVSVPPGSLSADYHTYGVDITQEALVFYFDRKEVWRQPGQPEFMKQMFIILNLAAGGGWPISKMPDPSVMYVDYVHAYQRKADEPAPR